MGATRAARTAGAMPNNTIVAAETRAVKPITRQSNDGLKSDLMAGGRQLSHKRLASPVGDDQRHRGSDDG